ncbi:hypothetical protein JHK87_052337 [Glycine soja]|nr:hypothetical protein JHK87_052337 [Glycine soja]
MGLFLLACVLFRLTCELQILRFEGLHKLFEGCGSDANMIFREHMRIRRQLWIMSHRYRFFIITCLVTIMISQLGSLLLVLESKSNTTFFNSGDLVDFIQLMFVASFIIHHPYLLWLLTLWNCSYVFLSVHWDSELGNLRREGVRSIVPGGLAQHPHVRTCTTVPVQHLRPTPCAYADQKWLPAFGSKTELNRNITTPRELCILPMRLYAQFCPRKTLITNHICFKKEGKALQANSFNYRILALYARLFVPTQNHDFSSKHALKFYCTKGSVENLTAKRDQLEQPYKQQYHRMKYILVIETKKIKDQQGEVNHSLHTKGLDKKNH